MLKSMLGVKNQFYHHEVYSIMRGGEIYHQECLNKIQQVHQVNRYMLHSLYLGTHVLKGEDFYVVKIQPLLFAQGGQPIRGTYCDFGLQFTKYLPLKVLLFYGFAEIALIFLHSVDIDKLFSPRISGERSTQKLIFWRLNDFPNRRNERWKSFHTLKNQKWIIFWWWWWQL